MHVVVLRRSTMKAAFAVLALLLATHLFWAYPTATPADGPSAAAGGSSTSADSQAGARRAAVFRAITTNRAAVAITFDDGPDPAYTPQILDILDRFGAKATFFVLGSQAEQHPDLLRQIAARGHEVGTHGYRHQNLTKLKPEAIAADLGRADRVIAAATGVRPRDLRPPYGFFNQAVLQEAGRFGYRVILWTDEHDPKDWTRPGAAEIVQRAMKRAEKGMILLLHDSGGDRAETVKALPRILQGLREKGYQVVTVDSLLQEVVVGSGERG